MTTEYNASEIDRLVREGTEDNERMTPGPWYAKRTSASRYQMPLYDPTTDRGEVRWFVTAVDPEHPCWRDDMASYNGLGVWTHDGVTTEDYAAAIARTRNNLPATVAALSAAKAEVERLTIALDQAREMSGIKQWAEDVKLSCKYAAERDRLAAEVERLTAQLAGAEAANATVTEALVEHSELTGHMEIVEQCHDYLAHEVMDSGDPTGKLQDFVGSLRVVIDQLDKQRRSRNWYEVAYTAGKQKLIEHALSKVRCKGEPHTCDQEAVAAAEGKADRLIIENTRLSARVRELELTEEDREVLEFARERVSFNLNCSVASEYFSDEYADRHRHALAVLDRLVKGGR